MFKSLRTAIRSFGFDVVRYPYRGTYTSDIAPMLERLGINIVFDVGANIGQFASELLESGYKGNIVSFEPQSESHAQLGRAAEQYKNWHVHKRVAVGNYAGTATLNISKNSVSSSLREMLDAHQSAAPDSVFVCTENVDVINLDSVIYRYVKSPSKIFIKIDTQGYEMEVLEGAERLVNLASGIICELSLQTLYDGQASWMDIVRLLGTRGYLLWGISPGLVDPTSGRLLQVDGIFIRGCEDLARSISTK